MRARFCIIVFRYLLCASRTASRGISHCPWAFGELSFSPPSTDAAFSAATLAIYSPTQTWIETLRSLFSEPGLAFHVLAERALLLNANSRSWLGSLSYLHRHLFTSLLKPLELCGRLFGLCSFCNPYIGIQICRYTYNVLCDVRVNISN